LLNQLSACPYLGSVEEVDDLKAAYIEHDGLIDTIMQHIPHSTFEDEARFIIIISDLIKNGDLPSLKTWEKSVKDEKAKLVRKKQGEKEAAEAEELAKGLGVWDEFYGSGKPTAKKGKGKSKKVDEGEDEEDTSALQALILKKRKNMDSFFDGLAAKYAEPPAKGKGKKKRGKADEEDDEIQESPKKKARKGVSPPPPPELNDQEFEKLQAKLFPKLKPDSKGKADVADVSPSSSSPKKKATRARKAR
jgi:DnaJ homolog subfamily C member 9